MAARTRLVQDIQLMEEDARLFNRKTDTHGREVGDVVDIGLLKTWLKRCKDGHEDICEKVWWRNWKKRLPKTVRMVDVKKMCIVPVPDDCSYAALSYVWGGVGSTYQTMQANLPGRMKTGGLDVSILPATIVDAIELCKRLGERYLWIDALCIVQDSPDDKAIQIGVMEMIYGGAFVTFFAVGGHDARAGLPGFRARTRGKHQTIEVVKDLHLAVPLPDLKEVLTKSVWGTRGYRLDKTAFRYGMPLRDLDNAMLWSPVDSAGLVRRAIPAESPWLASVLRGQRRDHEKTQGDDDAKVGRAESFGKATSNDFDVAFAVVVVYGQVVTKSGPADIAQTAGSTPPTCDISLEGPTLTADAERRNVKRLYKPFMIMINVTQTPQGRRKTDVLDVVYTWMRQPEVFRSPKSVYILEISDYADYPNEEVPSHATQSRAILLSG
ncbi:hypothetical protein EYR40_005859 [Pleurotus pulmonarius]|nr:hypothetical protein EYR36_003906 [Pleurotus pulmonarius]KAF4574420.1 hypothetical protein EYR36_005755 [Pleurotus pulmonarius]KAF4602644.1 hypothetical protein EYR40_005859 [Pleurotus pulmonarius]